MIPFLFVQHQSATFGDDPRVAILSALSGNGRCRGAFASCQGGTHPNITLFIRVNISGIAPGMDQLYDRICLSRKEAVLQMRSWDRPRVDATIAVERRPYSGKRERRPIVAEREPQHVLFPALRVSFQRIVGEAAWFVVVLYKLRMTASDG
jgi:hypothetical protein